MSISPAAKILVAGSLAYDHIMRYQGLFEEMILPNMLDALSVTFTTPTQQIYFGGCGGNIAYTLKLLGGHPLLLGLAGKDFDNYGHWLTKNKIDGKGIKILENIYTASAFILTDQKQHQITIFQEGAMQAQPDALSVTDFKEETIALAIIAPDDARRMVRLAQECFQHGIPYIFDPAQQIGNLSSEDLRTSIQNAAILVVNEYESELLMKKLKMSHYELTALTRIYIETQGEKGCFVQTTPDRTSRPGNLLLDHLQSNEAQTFRISAVKPKTIVDPTGCGDAFRAGVLFGLAGGFDLKKSCKIGSLAATYNLEQEGTQNHAFTGDEFQQRFEANFGEKL